MGKTKICTMCGEELPATNDYFYKYNRKEDGLYPSCKLCQSKKDKMRYGKDMDKKKEHAKKYRNEHKEHYKEYSKEYLNKNRDKIENYRKEYYSKNKEEIIKKVKIWKISNVERSKEYYKEYNEINKNTKSEYDKDRYENNRDKILNNVSEYRLKNKDLIKIRKKKYYISEKGKITSIISHHKRKSKQKLLDSSFTNKQWYECKEFFNDECAYCGKNINLTQDHFVPVSNSGEYTKNNIIPACKSCNSSKNNKDFFEWYSNQGFYNKERERKILQYLNYDLKTKIQQLALI